MDLLTRDVVPADAEAIVGILNPIIEARIYTAFAEPVSPGVERNYIFKFPARGVWKVAASDVWVERAGRPVTARIRVPVEHELDQRVTLIAE